MAIQYVGGNTGVWAGAVSGNNTVSLTALTGGLSSSAAAGDIVIAVYVVGSTADRALTITDGTNNYTLVDSELYSNGTSYDTNLRVAYKLLTAADASVTFGPTGNNADAGAAAVHVWRGVNSTTPLDVAAVPATGTGTGRPDAAAITPTTTGAEIIVAGGASAATGANFTSSLSNFITTSSADTNDAMIGVGAFDWTSGTYNPAAWTGGTTNAADSWAAMTIALRPEPPPVLETTPGSYAVTGSSAQTLAGELIQTTPGAYALAGASANLLPVWYMGATPGSYSLTGSDGELTYYPGNSFNYVRWDSVTWDDFYWDEIRVEVTSGAYSVTGFSADLSKATAPAAVLDVTPGSYSIAGTGPTVLLRLAISAQPGSYLLSGSAASTYLAAQALTTPGAYSLTGASARTLLTAIAATTPGSYAVTGASPGLELGQAIVTTPGAYSVAGSAATTLATFQAQTTPGSLAIAGAAASTLVGAQAQTTPGSYALSGAAASTLANLSMLTTPGAYSVAGSSATTAMGVSLQTQPGSMTITGSSANMTLTAAGVLAVTPGSYSLTGSNAEVVYVGKSGTAYRGFIVNMGRLMLVSSGEEAPPIPDVDNLILEDGDSLLLEDGGLILLE